MCQRVSPYCDVLIENECEYLNWTLAGLLSPRASRDWTQGLLTHETPSLYHLLFKISLPLNTSLELRWSYIIWWRAANPGLSSSLCLPWYKQFKIIPGGSSGQNSSGENILEVNSQAVISSQQIGDSYQGRWDVVYQHLTNFVFC